MRKHGINFGPRIKMEMDFYSLMKNLKIGIVSDTKTNKANIRAIQHVFKYKSQEILFEIAVNTKEAINEKIESTRTYAHKEGKIKIIDAINIYGPFYEDDTVAFRVGDIEEMNEKAPWWFWQNYGTVTQGKKIRPKEIPTHRWKRAGVSERSKGRNYSYEPVTMYSKGITPRKFIEEGGGFYLSLYAPSYFEERMEEELEKAKG